MNLLVDSVINNDAQRLRQLLANGEEPNTIWQEIPVLTWAINASSASIVDALLKGGANPNFSGLSGTPPLVTACSIGNEGIVTNLLDFGALVDGRSAQGMTALMTAAKFGFLSLVENLINVGADVNAKDLMGRTPLHWSVTSVDEPEIVSNILRNGGKVDALDNNRLGFIDYASRLQRERVLSSIQN